MKKETLFLKISLFLVGLIISLFALLVFSVLFEEAGRGSTQMAIVLYALMTIMTVTFIPFFGALYHTKQLLNYIDKNQAFSEHSVNSLKIIKKFAASISILYLISMPLFFVIGEVDDAPGVILVGGMFVFSPLVIAIFTTVLEKLLTNALVIKKENDLTI
ncbi:DUF2975 domain-containing protein [Lacticigenium naphthae]|uniref:DUF2975 domain-containing protein n=1 Tax=Lacticigenium naphthae TaxID=515351 RepID=UPI0004289E4C|nr:DUF2975 domain-containing protein [Lacticigenium naphthae]